MKTKHLSLALLICICVVFLAATFTACDDNKKNGDDYVKQIQVGDDFTILQLADVQLGERPGTSKHKTMIENSFGQIRKLIEEAKPNLIVLTGDQVGGAANKQNTQLLVDELDKYNIPFAPVFGNHDREKVSSSDLCKIYSSAKNSLFSVGPQDIKGEGNYIIQLMKDKQLVYEIFMFDSNKYRTYSTADKISSKLGGSGGYDYIYPNQIEWYAKHVSNTTKEQGKVINSLMFFHIPLPEFRYYSKENSLLGAKGEEQCNPYTNTGLFDKAVELGSTKGIFVGHDHVNNYLFEHKGIKMGYGLKTGLTSYFDKKLQGGSVIKFNKDFTDFTFNHIYKEYSK